EGSVEILINPREITITADNQSIYCGQDEPELTYQITSGALVNGDTFSGSLERESGDAAETYKIIQGTLTLGSNYDLTVIEGVFTINAISSIDATQTFVNIQINNTGQLSATISPAIANVPVTFTIYKENNIDVEVTLSGMTNASGVASVNWTAPGTIGVYKVDVMAGSSACDAVMEAYVSVFDPSASFVTGGGWFNSPEGAMPEKPQAVGKANFGFVSRYKKGKNNMTTEEVDGNTEFQFHAGDLNFKSTLHESGSLVISGRRATYRGTGTINGQSGFRFMVVAIDGDWNGQKNPDSFRIKITTTSGTIIYDNQMGSDENTEDATILGNNGTGGGSIVIHEVKGKGPNKNIQASLIEVPWNTPVDQLEKELQKMATDWFDGENYKISLDPVDYNPLEPGFYQVSGYFENNPWFAREETIPVPVMVLSKALPEDILIDNNLVGTTLQVGAVVGKLNTVDSLDDIHMYSMDEDSNFGLEGNAVTWKGEGIPPVTATLRVHSTDRAGQTISREIQLFRETGSSSMLIYPNPALKETNILVNLI
ncbi:MAG: hypothetical protein LPJ98_16380, partial [Cyclobacteriaceae bacterium]|nr:hypothetical protein [Cyclobacteriaceae bacterium]